MTARQRSNGCPGEPGADPPHGERDQRDAGATIAAGPADLLGLLRLAKFALGFLEPTPCLIGRRARRVIQGIAGLVDLALGVLNLLLRLINPLVELAGLIAAPDSERRAS
jgi:hypothetical protein